MGWIRVQALAATVALALTGSCTNIGLAELLENPAGAQILTAFVGSVNTAGELGTYSAGIFVNCSGSQGLLRADCACRTMAGNAGLRDSNNYIALMSAAAYDMTCRITGSTSQLLNCSLPSGGPKWANTNGQIIAKGYAGLLSGNLLAPLNLTENKSTPTATLVWTGTQAGGQFFNNGSNNCGDFTVGSVNNSVVGDFNSTSSSWLNTGTVQGCTLNGTIYCIAKP